MGRTRSGSAGSHGRNPVPQPLTAFIPFSERHSRCRGATFRSSRTCFINGGIFALVQHLSNPNPPITFDELSEGLAAMVSHCVERELQLAAGDVG